MKTRAQRTQQQTPIQPKANRQASAGQILQAYRQRTVKQPVASTKPMSATQRVIQRAFAGPNFAQNNPVNLNYGGHQFAQGGTQANTNCGTTNSIRTAGEQANGGGSQPGDPANLDRYKDGYDRPGGLARDPKRNQTATRIHLINHRLENSGNTQNTPTNILLGSQRANNPTHLNKVEKHVIKSLNHSSGDNADYEQSMGQAQTLNNIHGNAVTYWPAADKPQASVLPTAMLTRCWLDTNGAVTTTKPQPPKKKMKLNTGKAPKAGGYYVFPDNKKLPRHLWLNYVVAGNYNGAPQFVTNNINHERTQNGGAIHPTDQSLENNMQQFENSWKDNAFPSSFDSDASYYYASWRPANPYYRHDENTENIPTDL